MIIEKKIRPKLIWHQKLPLWLIPSGGGGTPSPQVYKYHLQFFLYFLWIFYPNQTNGSKDNWGQQSDRQKNNKQQTERHLGVECNYFARDGEVEWGKICTAMLASLTRECNKNCSVALLSQYSLPQCY